MKTFRSNRFTLAAFFPFLAGLLLTANTLAQVPGSVFFNNRYLSGFGAPIIAPIYGPEPGNPSLALRGNATTNGGSQIYSGPLLIGTGYSAALYGGPAVITDENDPQLLHHGPIVPFWSSPNLAGFSSGRCRLQLSFQMGPLVTKELSKCGHGTIAVGQLRLGPKP